MKTNTHQYEILLVKSSSFCFRQLLQSNLLKDIQHQPYHEQLEAACWNGWLTKTLPELIENATPRVRLYLWEILQAKTCLYIELCEHPQIIDVHYSINPYAVLTSCVIQDIPKFAFN